MQLLEEAAARHVEVGCPPKKKGRKCSKDHRADFLRENQTLAGSYGRLQAHSWRLSCSEFESEIVDLDEDRKGSVRESPEVLSLSVIRAAPSIRAQCRVSGFFLIRVYFFSQVRLLIDVSGVKKVKQMDPAKNIRIRVVDFGPENGSLHQKRIVSDNQHVWSASANLTYSRSFPIHGHTKLSFQHMVTRFVFSKHVYTVRFFETTCTHII
jgi:hypothetical protein